MHAEQWARYSTYSGYVRDYYDASIDSKVRCGSYEMCNKFEVEANLYWGGYRSVPLPIPK